MICCSFRRRTNYASMRLFAVLVVSYASCCRRTPASAEAAYCSAATAAQRSGLWSRHDVPVVTTMSSKETSPTSVAASLSSDCDGRPSEKHNSAVMETRLRAGASSSKLSETQTCGVWNKHFARELFAELIGTAMIVGLGTGAVMSAIFTNSLVGLFQVASVWIIAITLAIATTGPISGAQLNPAISFAFALIRPRSFAWNKVIPYSMAQLVGAVVASGTNFFLYASMIEKYEKVNAIVRGTAESIASAKAFGQYFESIPANTMGLVIAFSAEALGTAILSFVIFALTNPKNDTVKNKVFIPPLIGATVGALIAFLAPLTQAGFNPARDFAPRIVAYLAGWKGVALQGWWVYAVAPFVGAPIGAFVADKMLYGDD